MRADLSARAEMMALDRIGARVDSLMGMLDAVRCGMGIGLLLCLLAEDEKDLIQIAEPLDELDTELWILTHPDIKQVARIKALADISYTRNSVQVTKLRVSMREEPQ